MSRILIVVGLVIAAIGLLWGPLWGPLWGLIGPWLGRLGLGRLPGDILIERGNFTFYAPIGTGILISLVLSLILWLINR